MAEGGAQAGTRVVGAMPGGRRRIDRVLAPDFLDGMSGWPTGELRARRVEAEQEEVDLSYVRRILHGRLDLLRVEQESREHREEDGGADAEAPAGGTTGEGDAGMVAGLAAALSDSPAPAFGMGRHTVLEPSRAGEHRRAVEAAVADVVTSDVGALDDDQLVAAREHLEDLEHQVSLTRREVQQVLDALSGELARRYGDGEADVDEILAGAMQRH